MTKKIQTEVLVLGAGPGGYTAAFRAADLGKKVVLVERYPNLGGVCLNVGCIPSKALLHMTEVMEEAEHLSKNGIEFGKPQIKLDKIRAWKNSVVSQLTQGLAGLAKMRKVEVITGVGKFKSNNKVVVDNNVEIEFEKAIIAAGSMPVKLPFLPDSNKIMDSTDALKLEDIPENLLVIGGGIIGMEMAQVYHAFGSKITVVELTDEIFPGVDRDLMKPLLSKLEKNYTFLMETKVTKALQQKDGILVQFEGKNAPEQPVRFDKVLSAVGRSPNGKSLGLENTDVELDERGFIKVNSQLCTSASNIYAIGDIVGNPMLAHKALPEAHVAAEVVAGKKHHFSPLCIPSVAYTSPEVAWVGLTEKNAKEQKLNYGLGVFPWAACGRAISMGATNGITKLIFDKDTNKIIGGGIVGAHAGDLIAEISLAIEMGCEAEDLALTIHPHPTLVETIALASEQYLGCITDLPNKK